MPLRTSEFTELWPKTLITLWSLRSAYIRERANFFMDDACE